jgi:hypothetical protein
MILRLGFLPTSCDDPSIVGPAAANEPRAPRPCPARGTWDVALSFCLFMRAALRKPLLSASASPEFVAKTCHDYSFGPPLYLAVTVTGF